MVLELTNEIIEWCKAEHFNFMWSNTLVLVIALVFIMVAIICREIKIPFSDDIEKFHTSERILSVTTVSFLYGALILIIWFLWKTRRINGI